MPFPLIALAVKHLLGKTAVHHATAHTTTGVKTSGSNNTQKEIDKEVLKRLAEDGEEKEDKDSSDDE